MPSAENAILYYEAGQTVNAMTALTDQGDHISFDSPDELWSNNGAYAPDVAPNGVLSGGAVTPAVSATNDLVDVAALICNLAGVETTVNADTDVAITRGLTTFMYCVTSITVTSAGAIAAVAGDDGTTPSEIRGASGGPPWIPLGSIEIAQVRTSSITAAPITADEIFSVPGTHKELSLFPGWTIKHSRVDDNVQEYAGVDMDSALPLIHSADAGATKYTKKIYASWYEPTFAELPKSTDFKPPANSKSVSSTQVYGGTIGSVSTSLSGGGFTAYLTDGVTDGFLARDGLNLFFKFKPDRLKDPFILCQGYLGISQSFPAANAISAACTISAEAAAQRVS